MNTEKDYSIFGLLTRDDTIEKINSFYHKIIVIKDELHRIKSQQQEVEKINELQSMIQIADALEQRLKHYKTESGCD